MSSAPVKDGHLAQGSAAGCRNRSRHPTMIAGQRGAAVVVAVGAAQIANVGGLDLEDVGHGIGGRALLQAIALGLEKIPEALGSGVAHEGLGVAL